MAAIFIPPFAAPRRAALLAAVSVAALTRPAGAAPPPLSAAWFAARPNSHAAAVAGATAAGRGVPAGSASTVQNSLAAMTRAAAAIRAAQAGQATARIGAFATPSTVPDGLAAGGLQVPAGTLANGPTWTGANLPTQATTAATTGAGATRQRVTVQQTAKTATLTWQTFNVGKQTDLVFDQSAAGGATATVLNRVSDPAANPTLILGTITAPGQVLVINRNGIVFGGASQVNVGALLAATADIPDAMFRANGIYSTATTSTSGSNTSLTSYAATFGAPGAGILVQAGAQIATNPPASVTAGGGGVILLGSAVQNDGQITTPGGQTVLAAGQGFLLRPGYTPTPAGANGGLTTSTTVGTEVTVTRASTSAPTPDAVSNTGLIQAAVGDVSLVGNTLTQSGVIVSTTSASQRGTVHLLTGTVTTTTTTNGTTTSAYTADPTATTRFGPGSLTLVDVDSTPSSALLSQHQGLADEQHGANGNPNNLDAARANLMPSPFVVDVLPTPDRLDLSRIDVTTGGSVDVGPNALLRATGGQISIRATSPTSAALPARVLIEGGATLDVSGSVDVTLPATALALPVTIQGNELRDSPVNRDTLKLNSAKVTVDVSQLVAVVAGTGGYPTTRYYTPNGLLEVGGELNNVAHGEAEFTTIGGQATIQADQLVTQPGALVNLSGGSVRYQSGLVPTSTLVGTDGRLYNIDTAPADIAYAGLYQGFTVDHARWGVTQTYDSPFIAPGQVMRQGFSAGQNAGALTVNAPTTVFEGSIDAATVVGERQVAAPIPAASLSGSLVRPPTAVPAAGTLSVSNTTIAGLSLLSAEPVSITDKTVPVATGVTLTSALDAAHLNAGVFSAAGLSAAGLGGLTVAVNAPVTIDSPLTLAPGAAASIVSPVTTIAATLTLRSGSLALTDYLPATGSAAAQITALAGPAGSGALAGVTLTGNGAIDTRGLFTNIAVSPGIASTSAQAYVNGGAISIDVSKAVSLRRGSTIDTSSGAIVAASGALSGSGVGGSVTIVTYDPFFHQTGLVVPTNAPEQVAGSIRSVGVAGGGAFALAVPSVAIASGQAAGFPVGLAVDATGATVDPAFFQSGFRSYSLTGYDGVVVAPGTAVAPVVPVYQVAPSTAAAPTGSDAAAVLATIVPPTYLPNALAATLTQRVGADLTLAAGLPYVTAGPRSTAPTATQFVTAQPLTIGAGASITVDPGHRIELDVTGQTTISGALVAPGGTVSVLGSEPLLPSANGPPFGNYTTVYQIPLSAFGASVYLDGSATIDVSGLAVVASDRFNRPFGVAPAGGVVALGAATSGIGDGQSTSLFVVAAPGSNVAASGAQAAIDTSAGTSPGSPGVRPAAQLGLIGGDGGAINVNSQAGVVLAGLLTAGPGLPAAAGGKLSVTLAQREYPSDSTTATQQDASRAVPRELTISAGSPPFAAVTTPFNGQPLTVPFGGGTLSTSQINAGGFGSVSLTSADAIVFDGVVSLAARNTISLTAGALTHTSADSQVSITAQHVALNGLDNGGAGVGSSLSTVLISTSTYQTGLPVKGSLSIFANEIDLSSLVFSGYATAVTSANHLNNSTDKIFSRAGFADVLLNSSGDVRFLAAPTGATGSTASPTVSAVPSGLFVSGNLSVTAAQIYPVSGASGQLVAGYNPSTGLSPTGTLTIASALAAPPAAPLSVGGSLTLSAGVIDQNGVVRAPLGQITFGQIDGVRGQTNGIVPVAEPPGIQGSTPYAINFGAGSLTSVSAAGLTVPVGGTPDGLSFTLLGAALQVNGSSLVGAGTITPAPLPTTPVVRLLGQSIDIAPGATIDLSGGGTLAGAGFIAGRGGSVNPLLAPTLRFPPAGTSTAASTDQVYAIVPGLSGYAQPAQTGNSANAPAAGQTITLVTAAGSLPAGTYTLQPAELALLPGAYRVEVTTSAKRPLLVPLAPGDGSVTINANLGFAGSGTVESLPIQATVSSGAVVRTTGQFNEETFSQFAVAQAAIFGNRRARIPEDAGTLYLGIAPPTILASEPSFVDQGAVLFGPGPGGRGGLANISASGGLNAAGSSPVASAIEVTATGVPVAPGATGFRAADLDALGAPTLVIGGSENDLTVGVRTFNNYFQPNALSMTGNAVVSSGSVTVRGGATLTAGEVVLVSGGQITVERGAAIDTVGRGAPAQDAAGIQYASANATTLVVSNNLLSVALSSSAPGGITVGATGPAGAGGAILASEGTIAFLAANAVSIDRSTRFGASALFLSVPSINIGTDAALAAAGASVPAGLTLGQSVLTPLLNGDPTLGTPRLSELVLQASTSVNLFGTVTLDTTDPTTGLSSLGLFVLDTPSIAGTGAAGDVARIVTGGLVWNGIINATSTASLPTLVPGTTGPGTGKGTLEIDAQTITLGYPSIDPPQRAVQLLRSLPGFATSALNATDGITFNANGALAAPGALTLASSQLSGASGATLAVSAGGAISLAASPGHATTTTPGFGATLALTAGTSLTQAGVVALPGGQLTLTAANDVVFAPGSQTDLSGRSQPIFDQVATIPGGALVAQSTSGNISLAPGAAIDVSATADDAGSVSFTALHGTLGLGAAISSGGAAGHASGVFTARAGTADFAALAATMDAGQFFGGRAVELATGNVVVSAPFRAHSVSLSVDGGALTVDGTIDASGPAPGSIRLAAATGLTLTANARLDAHGAVLQVDGYGLPIDASNRGTVALSTTAGTLTLAPGSVIDVSAPDGVARGRVVLVAPRLAGGSVGVSATGPITIAGATSVVLDAVRTYAPGDAAGTFYQNAGALAAVPSGALSFATIDADDAAFMAAAVGSGDLAGRLAGLSGTPAFQLRPGVEIDSSAASGGNLTLAGDLNLAQYRYAAGPYGLSPVAGAYGSGEPLDLTVRAANNLTIGGSVTDGFGLPPEPTGVNTAGVAVGINPDETGFTNRPTVTIAGRKQSQGLIYATAPLLPAGTQSASIALVSGALLTAADTRAVLPTGGFPAGGGNTVFNDLHSQRIAAVQTKTTVTTSLATGQVTTTVSAPVAQPLVSGDPIFSVVRTGVGDLTLATAGSISQQSPFSIYTAGAQPADAPAPTRGNSISGAAGVLSTSTSSKSSNPNNNTSTTTTTVTTFLAYEALIAGSNYQTTSGVGGGDLSISAGLDVVALSVLSPTLANNSAIATNTLGAAVVRTATGWSGLEGTYADLISGNQATIQSGERPVLVGFDGFGTLGGGNLTVIAGRNAGAADPRSTVQGEVASEGLNLAVLSSGQIVNGKLAVNGGGSLSLIVGGALNGGLTLSNNPSSNLYGYVADLRGPAVVSAGSIGNITLGYATVPGDPRPPSSTDVTSGQGVGGIVLVPGDGVDTVRTRGDLVFAGAGDPTRLAQQVVAANPQTGVANLYASFSLWQPTTAINLASAGGGIALGTQPVDAGSSDPATDGRFLLPPTLTANAANGSVYLAKNQTGATANAIELAPSPSGQLSILAGGSLFGSFSDGTRTALDISGADPSTTTSVAHPLVNVGAVTSNSPASNNNLFAFGADTASGSLHANDPSEARVYALGDVIGLLLGEVVTTSSGSTQYRGAKAVAIRAGRDLVGFGTTPGTTFATDGVAFSDKSTGGLIVNARPSDVSVVAAGRDVDFLNLTVAGAGALYVSAGRNVTQQNQGALTSIGTTATQGAAITVAVGVGATGPDYAAFAARYLDPANTADPTQTLAAQQGAGKVVQTYADQLLAFLRSTYGYAGDASGALAAFEALPAEAQSVFLLPIYFDELRLSGREYTNPDSPRVRSYLRGREAIATLFPATGSYAGDLSLFPSAPVAGKAQPGSKIVTDAGGGVTVLAPGGGVSIGTNSLATPGGEGILTQGQGDIDIFAQNSVLLGTSRVFTTFGGSIVIWANAGDINAGRGASSTNTFSPIQVVYANTGAITLSPNISTTGAGIATLAPLAGTVPGDVDLIAPQGTIDAGEAGIRVAGNLNVSALVIANAANVQVAGTSTGTPTVPVVNVAAASSGAAAAAAAGKAADAVTRSQDRAQAASLITVEVSGLGPACGAPGQPTCR